MFNQYKKANITKNLHLISFIDAVCVLLGGVVGGPPCSGIPPAGSACGGFIAVSG